MFAYSIWFLQLSDCGMKIVQASIIHCECNSNIDNPQQDFFSCIKAQRTPAALSYIIHVGFACKSCTANTRGTWRHIKPTHICITLVACKQKALMKTKLLREAPLFSLSSKGKIFFATFKIFRSKNSANGLLDVLYRRYK